MLSTLIAHIFENMASISYYFIFFHLFLATFKEYPDFFDMVQLDQENSTQCAVYDKTPDSDQKKINIVVRPTYTVSKVISDISTQFNYKSFDLVLQPINHKDDLVSSMKKLK